jgi:hypothetical protein
MHRYIVAHFLRVRFPILLALNKADLPGAAAHVDEARGWLRGWVSLGSRKCVCVRCVSSSFS